MGKNQQRRRADKQRRRDRRIRVRAASPGSGAQSGRDPQRGDRDGFGRQHVDPDPGPPPVDVRGLLLAAASLPKGADPQPLLDEVMRANRAGGGRLAREATRVLLDFLATMYGHGWQPADLMHAAHKKLTSGGEWLLGALIHWDAVASMADARAPEEWCAQVEAIRSAQTLPGVGDSVIAWFADNGWPPDDAWREVVSVVRAVVRLPVLEELMDPPSRWPRERANRRDADAAPGPRGADAAAPTGSVSAAGHDPKVLVRIRALLAKAESTEFPDEAEALTGKAQALMSRYAIDEALLDSHSFHGSKVRARRVHIDSPYASTKVQLLSTVGAANRVRVIWIDSVDMATVVGFPIDLELVEMLYTSLLVQATRAMTEHGSTSPAQRSVSFRKAFLIAYAQRIGERLAEADAHAAAEVTGAELVLARRSREVDDEFDRLFPHTVQTRGRRVDARGYRAGRAAADRAKLAHGQLATEGRSS